MVSQDYSEDSAHLRRVIGRTIAEARAAGLDHETQTMQAARAVMVLRPHLTEREAMMLVRWVKGHELEAE